MKNFKGANIDQLCQNMTDNQILILAKHYNIDVNGQFPKARIELADKIRAIATVLKMPFAKTREMLIDVLLETTL